MENFNASNDGYNKKEVNEFVDYVIKKTEEHIEIIKNQQDEISKLQNDLNVYKKLENNYDYLNKAAELKKEETIALAKKEAALIINEAKNNADKLVNDALIKTEKLENQKDTLNRTIHIYKKKIRNTLMEQLDMIDDIEML